MSETKAPAKPTPAALQRKLYQLEAKLKAALDMLKEEQAWRMELLLENVSMKISIEKAQKELCAPSGHEHADRKVLA